MPFRSRGEDQCGPVCFSKISQVAICRYGKGQSLKSGLLGSKPMKLYIKDLPKVVHGDRQAQNGK